ncbi:MAG: hypothetical protein ACT6U0_20010 [Shinella sp.]|uniref:hypothetical protein n=1 Tax=Shinella sp. TaxID=1870904 RepID=UPI0040350368
MTGYARVDMASVAPLLPADKVAGRVASRGEHFEWSPTLAGKVHSADPLTTRAPTPQELGQPQFVDLKGVRIGRLTVLGIAAEVISKTGTNWVVRCVCGSYETRKAKYVKACKAGNNPGNEDPTCDWCGKTRRLQLGFGRNFEKQKARG